MLVHLYQSLKYVMTRNLRGAVAEFGVYQGGTTVFMAKVLQHYGYSGRIYGFDTFAGFPPRKHILDISRLQGIPLMLSFFDTDNYSPTRKALELCLEQTVQGGILAFDHYYSPGWNKTVGERIAIRQSLEKKEVLNFHGTGIFIKI